MKGTDQKALYQDEVVGREVGGWALHAEIWALAFADSESGSHQGEGWYGLLAEALIDSKVVSSPDEAV